MVRRFLGALETKLILIAKLANLINFFGNPSSLWISSYYMARANLIQITKYNSILLST